jgi:hypothetical protein
MLAWIWNIFKKKPVKLCKDCKWVGAGTYPLCLHYKALRNKKISLVDGKYEDDSRRSCHLMRDSCFPCKKRAKYFEPKV